MGPEGGAGGGTVVAEGTPEEVMAVPESYTGKFLAQALGASAPNRVKLVRSDWRSMSSRQLANPPAPALRQCPDGRRARAVRAKRRRPAGIPRLW
jgi:hypothetical protein